MGMWNKNTEGVKAELMLMLSAAPKWIQDVETVKALLILIPSYMCACMFGTDSHGTAHASHGFI